MGTIKILAGIICLAFIGIGNVLHGSAVGIPLHQARAQNNGHLLAMARKEIGVREESGRNDGKRIEAYLHSVGLRKGDPYCAAFISFIFNEAGYKEPRTGWSPALFPAKLLIRAAVPGNVFGIYFRSLNRIGHCGLVERVRGDWITGIEANTNVAGSREGDGVYRKIRHVRTVYCFADWTKGEGR